MHNKVVYRLARGLRKSGCVVLRFNYRGVNLSEGAYDRGLGETEDARVALGELQARYPYLPLMAAGFSFGSRVALRLTSQERIIRRVIPVGFPTTIAEHAFVYNVHVPKVFVQSTHDSFGPRPDFEAFFDTLPEPKQVEWIESVDHFFKDSLDEYEAAVLRIGLNRG
jgi:alpha/beta superfamily hydrolase